MSEAGNLPERRLAAIERAARERQTLGDRVTVALVQEIRRLRRALEQQAGDPQHDHTR